MPLGQGAANSTYASPPQSLPTLPKTEAGETVTGETEDGDENAPIDPQRPLDPNVVVNSSNIPFQYQITDQDCL